jgi:hypothetical protein
MALGSEYWLARVEMKTVAGHRQAMLTLAYQVCRLADDGIGEEVVGMSPRPGSPFSLGDLGSPYAALEDAARRIERHLGAYPRELPAHPLPSEPSFAPEPLASRMTEPLSATTDELVAA